MGNVIGNAPCKTLDTDLWCAWLVDTPKDDACEVKATIIAKPNGCNTDNAGNTGSCTNTAKIVDAENNSKHYTALESFVAPKRPKLVWERPTSKVTAHLNTQTRSNASGPAAAINHEL
jgi:hypothetical protein